MWASSRINAYMQMHVSLNSGSRESDGVNFRLPAFDFERGLTLGEARHVQAASKELDLAREAFVRGDMPELERHGDLMVSHFGSAAVIERWNYFENKKWG